MSKEIMTQNDIPKYIIELLPRLKKTIAGQEKGIVGYTFALYGQRKIGGIKTLLKEADKLVNFSKRYNAESFIVENHIYYDTVYSKAEAYKQGFHNYVIIVITDLVAKQLEIAGGLYND